MWKKSLKKTLATERYTMEGELVGEVSDLESVQDMTIVKVS
jgi:hypothetical protein